MSDTIFQELSGDNDTPGPFEDEDDLLAPFRDYLTPLEEDVQGSEDSLVSLEKHVWPLEVQPLLLEQRLKIVNSKLLMIKLKLSLLKKEQPEDDELELDDYDLRRHGIYAKHRLRKPSKLRRVVKFVINILGLYLLLSPLWILTVLFSRPSFIMRSRIRQRECELWDSGYVSQTEAKWERRWKLWDEAKKAAKARPGDSIRKASLRSIHRSDMREDRYGRDSLYQLKCNTERKANRPYRVKRHYKFRFGLLWQDEGLPLVEWLLARMMAASTQRKVPRRSGIFGGFKIHRLENAAKKPDGTGGKPPTSKDGRRLMSTSVKASSMAMRLYSIETGCIKSLNQRIPHRALPRFTGLSG